jgi:hypothetical protein
MPAAAASRPAASSSPRSAEPADQPSPSTRIACAAIRCSPRAFGWTTTALVPCSTGSTHRTPSGRQASWPPETRLTFGYAIDSDGPATLTLSDGRVLRLSAGTNAGTLPAR